MTKNYFESTHTIKSLASILVQRHMQVHGTKIETEGMGRAKLCRLIEDLDAKMKRQVQR